MTLKAASALATPSSRLQYASLDAWRGFAALWVVMVHCAITPIVLQHSTELQRVPLYAFSVMGSLGVQIFFVISGVCIANAAVAMVGRPGGCWKFARARFWRIYPPYFMASLASIAMAMLAMWLLNRGYLQSSATAAHADILHRSPLYLFASLTLTQVPLGQQPIVIVFWTLCYEVAFYAIALLCMAITANGRSLLNCLHILTFGSLVALVYDPRHGVFPFDLWPHFGLGLLVYDILQCQANRRIRIVAIAATCGMVVLAILDDHGGHLGKVGTRGQCIASVLFATGLVLLYRADRQLMATVPARLLASVGLFSYSLYLTHPLVQGVVLQLFRRFRPINPDTFVYVYWLQLVCAIPCAFVFFLLFERPLMRRKNSKTQSPSPAKEADSSWAASDHAPVLGS